MRDEAGNQSQPGLLSREVGVLAPVHLICLPGWGFGIWKCFYRSLMDAYMSQVVGFCVDPVWAEKSRIYIIFGAIVDQLLTKTHVKLLHITHTT